MSRPSKKSLILDLLDQDIAVAEVARLAEVRPEYVRTCRQRRNGPSASDRKYLARPEVRERDRERRRAYWQRPEVSERQRERMRAYSRRPEVRERARAKRAAMREAAAGKGVLGHPLRGSAGGGDHG